MNESVGGWMNTDRSYHVSTWVLQSRHQSYQARCTEAHDRDQNNRQYARQTDLHVVDQQHSYTEIVDRRSGRVDAAIIVIAEQPHVAHYKPDQPEGIDGVAEVLHPLQGLPPVLQPSYIMKKKNLKEKKRWELKDQLWLTYLASTP